MKKIFILLFVLSICGVNLAQDTLTTILYKNDTYTETTNLNKAKFALYEIENKDKSISTIKYSFDKKMIVLSETMMDNKPSGIWLSEWDEKEDDYKCKIEYFDPQRSLNKNVFELKDTVKLLEVDEFINAQPIGGEAAVNNVLLKVEYPQIAVDNDIQGQVLIRCVINEKGIAQEFTIYKTADKFLDKAALKAVQKLPNFIPASLNGNSIKVSKIIPINFRLG